MEQSIVAAIVSDDRGEYVERIEVMPWETPHRARDLARRLAAKREGWASGVEFDNGEVTFEFD